MINVEAALTAKFPKLNGAPAIIRKPTLAFLKQILHESEINGFLSRNADVSSFSWIDRVFEHLDFSYSVSAKDKANIPATGKIIIIANHPIGSLDGLALLKLVSEVRKDVKIVANDLLSHFAALRELIIPVDVLTNGSAIRGYKTILEELDKQCAVIIFPAGEVSRASPFGVRDSSWRHGFLNLAKKSGAAVLPILIKAKNSMFFYSASMLFKPISTLLLSNEMFKHQCNVIHFHIGEPIPAAKLHSNEVADKNLAKRLRKYLYKLDRTNSAVSFQTERTIAHPEDRQELQLELKRGRLLGQTRDNNQIILFEWFPDSVVMRELGRVREIAFRRVGEGTGKRRDLDKYDPHYLHLILWDKEALEIAGAYRIGDGSAILEKLGVDGFYTNSLYNYDKAMLPYLQTGIELGRSFVNPAYWGKASLDYLWQGLGAYLAQRPEVRYLFGPVSISAAIPPALIAELVFVFGKYYGSAEQLVSARTEFAMDKGLEQSLNVKYQALDADAALMNLQKAFQEQGLRIPVLFKQYAAQFEASGFHTLAFNVDAEFAGCVDGFCLTDLQKLKPAKRQRYIEANVRKL